MRSRAGCFQKRTDNALPGDFWALATHSEGLRVTHRVGRFWQERLTLGHWLVAPLIEKTVPVRFINGLSDLNSGQPIADRYRELVPGADAVRLVAWGTGRNWSSLIASYSAPWNFWLVMCWPELPLSSICQRRHTP